MKITIYNDTTRIEEIEQSFSEELNTLFSFADKAKQYQLKRLSKTIWGKSSPQAARLRNEINQSLLIRNDDGSVSFPTGLLGSIDPSYISSAIVIDHRTETGTKIALPWAKKPHDPRLYQLEGIELCSQNWRGLLNYATGLGKTLTAIYVIRAVGRKTLVLCPSKAIAEQFHGLLSEAFGSHRVGFFGDGRKSIKDLTVGIAPSVANHLADFKKANLGLIIADECHHMPADTFYAIAKELGDVGRIYGLTATDFRNDGKDLLINAGCGPTLIRRDAKWGIDNDFLAKPFFIVREVPTTGRDYQDDRLKNYKAHVLNSQEMKTRIESDAKKFIAAGKRVLILVDEVEHGQELSTNLGVQFATGEDKKSQSYIDDFNAKKVMGLVATDGKVGEGVDTRPVEVLIMANFTASKGAVLQAIGRGLRKIEGKESCVILDYCPMGCQMFIRHAQKRISYYRELTDKVKIIETNI